MRRKKKGLPKRITLTWLREQSACNTGMSKFKACYPRGVNLTRANLVIAWQRGNVNLWWMLNRLMDQVPGSWRKHTRRHDAMFKMPNPDEFPVTTSEMRRFIKLHIIADVLGIR